MDSGLGLIDALRAGRTTVSIITTYSIDFDFYETVVLRRLNASGCQHHLLLVDAERCAEALANPERRPRLAGIAYTLIPVSRVGAFHPKLIVLADKKGNRVLVGSHNLTFAGFGGNAEMTNAVSGTRPATSIVASALDAIEAWLVGAPAALTRDTLQLVRSLVKQPEGSPADDDLHLLYTGGNRPSLWEQLRPLVPKKVKRVLVAGPFFDAGLRFLNTAIKDLNAPVFVVVVDVAYSEIEPKAARKSGARFVDARGGLNGVGFPERSVLHAKFLAIESNDGWVLVSGSANPSAAAWLDRGTNAEAVLVRMGVPAAEMKRLGLLDFAEAPELTSAQWTEVSDRLNAEAAEAAGVADKCSSFVATENGGQVTVHGLRERPRAARLIDQDGNGHSVHVESYGDEGALLAAASIDAATCTVVEIDGPGGGLAIINHVGALFADSAHTSARAELQTALCSAVTDPAHIEEVLKIVERAIDDFDAHEVARAGRAGRQSDSDAESSSAGPLGPRSMSVDDVKRRHGQRRNFAAGNVSAVIDLLIRRISEGLPLDASAPGPREVEEKDLDESERLLPAPAKNVDKQALLKACHRKVRRMLRRMAERLEHTMETGSGATRTTVQLAAVLGVLRWLRRIERQLHWLPLGESLIPENARDELLGEAARCIGLCSPSLVDLVNAEVPEQCAEVSLSLGLLGWLGREADIDVRALARHPTEEDLPWFEWTGLLLAVLRQVVLDETTVKVLTDAVGEGKGADRHIWLETHLRLARAAALAAIAPEAAPTLSRAPQRGDLVRFVMRNGAGGVAYVIDIDDDTKVRLLDAERQGGRVVLREFVAPLDIEALAS